MADCTPKTIMAGASCLACDLTHKELLAALVYVLCTVNSMSCTPKSLAAASECIRCAFTEKQMLAAMVYLICNGGTGGGGGAAGVTRGNGSPVGVVNPASFVLYVQLDSSPLPGITWYSDGVTWH